MRHHVECAFRELFIYGAMALVLSVVTVAGFRGNLWVIWYVVGVIWFFVFARGGSERGFTPPPKK